MAMSCNSKGLLKASKYSKPPSAALERIAHATYHKAGLHAWSGPCLINPVRARTIKPPRCPSEIVWNRTYNEYEELSKKWMLQFQATINKITFQVVQQEVAVKSI